MRQSHNQLCLERTESRIPIDHHSSLNGTRDTWSLPAMSFLFLALEVEVENLDQQYHKRRVGAHKPHILMVSSSKAWILVTRPVFDSHFTSE